MMPLGLGVDVVDVDRVERLLAKYGDRVLVRLLTPDERAYCRTQALPARSVAVRLAAKEAAYKALTADRTAGWIGWQEVEIERGPEGRPQLRLHGRADAAAGRLGVRSTMVSLTHSHLSAAAVVMLLG